MDDDATGSAKLLAISVSGCEPRFDGAFLFSATWVGDREIPPVCSEASQKAGAAKHTLPLSPGGDLTQAELSASVREGSRGFGDY